MLYEHDDLISVKEASLQCSRNPETIRRWIWSGKLPAEKLGNQLFIKKNDLESYCRETAILEYEASPKSVSGSHTGRKLEKEMNKTVDDSGEVRVIKPGSRRVVIQRLRELQDQIRARMGRDFTEEEFQEMLDMMHEDPDEEISDLR
jgi:excisionase family DNA binding protein